MAQATVLGPNEMITQWQQALPDAVIETFNELLAKHFNGKTASIKEKELLDALEAKELSTKEVTDQRWLFQTQELYKEKGWKVLYRSPNWEQDFNPYFQFDLK